MRRPTIFLMLAMAAALLAAIVVFSALRNRESQVQLALAQTQKIVVAARDLKLGERLTPADVKLIRWSRQSIPEGAFTDPTAVENSYAKSELIEGEPIVQRNLISAERIPGVMPMMITPGMRALSVAVDEVSDIAGFVKPHTRVDVLVAVSGNGSETRPFSKIVLQNIEVLAVAQQIEKGKDEAEVAKVVTLLVSPHQAEKLVLAGREGTLRLAMRNYSDDKMTTTPGSDFADLLGASATTTVAFNTPAAVAQLAPSLKIRSTSGNPFAVEVMRDGKNAETVSFIAGSAHSSHHPSAAPAPPPIEDSAPASTVVPLSVPAAAPTVGSNGNALRADPSAAAYVAMPKTLQVP